MKRRPTFLLLLLLPLVSACSGRDEPYTLVTLEGVSLAVDRIDPARLYLEATPGLFRSLDGGRSWHPLAGLEAGLKRRIEGPTRGPRRLWAVGPTGQREVYRSDDDGETWRDLSAGLPGAPSGLAVDPADGERAWVATGTTLHRRDGAGWETVFTSVAAIESLTIDGSGALFAGLEGTLHRSGDGGRTWSPAHHGLPGGAAYELAFDPLVAGTAFALGQGRIYRSSDAGRSWSPWGDPLPTASVQGLARLCWAGWDLLLLDGAGDLFRMPLAGGGWTRVTLAPMWLLASDPANPGVAYAGGPAGVFRTVDGGASWAQADAGLPRRVETFPRED